jgi:putative DNA primase/helicase
VEKVGEKVNKLNYSNYSKAYESLEAENNVIEMPNRYFTVNNQGQQKFNAHLVKDEISKERPVYRTDLGNIMYKEGVYERVTVGDIKHVIHKKLGELATTSRDNEIINLLLHDKEFKSLKEFNSGANFFILENGIYNLTTKTFEKSFNPYLFSTYKFPVQYDPKAKCDELLNILNNVLEGDELEFYIEWLAYCMAFNISPNYILFLYGKGENGKSFLIYLMKKILGEKNISGVPLDTLTNNRFASSQLYGKVANLNADISPELLKDTSLLKQLTSGMDEIPAEFKGENMFTFVNYAKLTFSCNEMPSTVDRTHGFNRRILILPIEKVIPAEKQIAERELKMIADRNLSGFLNLVLEKYFILKKRNFKFKDNNLPVSMLEAKLQYVYDNDKVQQFLDENIERTDSAKDSVVAKHLFEAFKKYCDENNMKSSGSRKFNSAIEEKGIILKTGAGNKKYAYQVKFKESSEYAPY